MFLVKRNMSRDTKVIEVSICCHGTLGRSSSILDLESYFNTRQGALFLCFPPLISLRISCLSLVLCRLSIKFQPVFITLKTIMSLKCCTQYASKFGKLSSGHRTGKGQFSFQSQRKVMPKIVQITAHLCLFHMLAR